MAAIFDPNNLASPLAYGPAKTALILLDFQQFIIDSCGDAGKAAVAKAAELRNWALKQKMMVLHSIIDVKSQISPLVKSAGRIQGLLEVLKQDPSKADEPGEVAFDQRENEYIVLKPISLVSGLKAPGALELLHERGIKSILVCGLSTSGAVLRTTIGGPDEGFVVTVVQDACGDPREGIHETLIEHILPSRAHVATSEDFRAQWKMVKNEA